jgi:hypothetical protein
MDLVNWFYETFSFYGVGLHVIIAVFFAIHAIRNRYEMYWLWILFVFPFLGSVVYFFAIYLPNSRLEQGLKKGSTQALKILNPGKELRAARRAVDLTPSSQNQVRLANALLETGNTSAAIAQFEECLAKAPANDLALRLDVARAKIKNNQTNEAIDLLRNIRSQNPNFRVEDVTLLSAKALAAVGRDDDARAQFEYLLKTFGNFEGRVEYAIWLAQKNEMSYAQQLKAEIEHTINHWPRHSKQLNRALIQRLNSAFRG